MCVALQPGSFLVSSLLPSLLLLVPFLLRNSYLLTFHYESFTLLFAYTLGLSYRRNYDTEASVSGLFHLTLCPQGACIFL